MQPKPDTPAGPAGRADAAARGMQRKTFDCAFKADDADGAFDLYAAAFSNVDRQGEVISPGAFSNLPEFVAEGVGLVNHRTGDLPVAWIESASQDSKGLRVRGRFHTTPEAQACRTVVLERMAAGKPVKCSIGYRIDDYAIEEADGRNVLRIKSLRVYEFSFVNIPANPQAGVTSAKAAAPATEAPMHEPDEPRTSLLCSVKEWLGLSTKKGRAISKANHAALSTFADAMHEGGTKALEMAKQFRDHGKAQCALAGAMKERLKVFAPESDAEPDDEPDGDEAPRGEGKKSEAPPPPAATDDEYRRKLRERLSLVRPS